MCHVCQLWCVTPEANYKCEITHQLLPPANWGLTKWIENKLKILNIKTVFWITAIGSYFTVEFSFVTRTWS